MKYICFFFIVSCLSLLSTTARADDSLTTAYRIYEAHSDKVKWNSRLHRHDYYSMGLQSAVEKAVDLTDARPPILPLAVRMKMLEDNSDHRSDFIDLLSVTLKERFQTQWQNRPELRDFQFSRTTLWSLSKHRIRSWLVPEEPLPPWIHLVREAGLASKRFLMICSSPSAESQKKSIWVQAGISFHIYPAAKTTTVHCGQQEFEVTSRPLGYTQALSPPQEIRFSERLYATVVIALPDRTNPTTATAVKNLIRLHGYSLRETSDVFLEDELVRRFQSSDIFVPFSDIPHDNEFIFSHRQKKGLRFVFEKSFTFKDSSRTLELTVIVSPTASEVPGTVDGEGLRFTQEEMADLWRKRTKPLVILELSCFSDRYLNSWILSYRQSLHSTSQPLTPVVISSSEGHTAESPLETLAQSLFVLRALNDFYQGQTTHAVIQHLQSEHWILSMGDTLMTPLRWLGWGISLPSSFYPISTLQAPYNDYLGDMSAARSLELSGHHTIPKIFGPLVSGLHRTQ